MRPVYKKHSKEKCLTLQELVCKEFVGKSLEGLLGRSLMS